jgi:hypothetical protein
VAGKLPHEWGEVSVGTGDGVDVPVQSGSSQWPVRGALGRGERNVGDQSDADTCADEGLGDVEGLGLDADVGSEGQAGASGRSQDEGRSAVALGHD